MGGGGGEFRKRGVARYRARTRQAPPRAHTERTASLETSFNPLRLPQHDGRNWPCQKCDRPDGAIQPCRCMWRTSSLELWSWSCGRGAPNSRRGQATPWSRLRPCASGTRPCVCPCGRLPSPSRRRVPALAPLRTTRQRPVQLGRRRWSFASPNAPLGRSLPVSPDCHTTRQVSLALGLAAASAVLAPDDGHTPQWTQTSRSGQGTYRYLAVASRSAMTPDARGPRTGGK